MATTRAPLPRWLRWSVALTLCAGTTALVPPWWCGREGERWYKGDRQTVAALARHVAATVAQGVNDTDLTSDSALFRGEWMFGTYQMAALGLLQTCREHPALSAELRPGIENAITGLLSPLYAPSTPDPGTRMRSTPSRARMATPPTSATSTSCSRSTAQPSPTRATPY